LRGERRFLDEAVAEAEVLTRRAYALLAELEGHFTFMANPG
jgi:hypothetical protein